MVVYSKVRLWQRNLSDVGFSFCCFVVRAENDSQGYHKEETKGTTVTKDLLLKEENKTGHGTEAQATGNAYRHTAVASAKVPEVVSSATRPTPRLQRIQMTKAMTAIVFRDSQKLLASQKGNPTVTSIYTKSEMPLISNNEKIVLSTTPAAFESMINNTSEPQVNLSTDAVKSSSWLHTLHVNRSQRSSDSIPLTSADRGPGLPVLSASHPHVIDNLAALLHDNADKQAQGKDEKEISTLKRHKSASGTVQSIIQKPVLSPTVSSNSLSEGLTSDFHGFTPSGGKQQEIQKITKIKSSLSDTGTVAVDTVSLGETSSATQNDTKKQSRLKSPEETPATEGPVSTSPALHRSGREWVKNREAESFGEMSTLSPGSKLHPLSTNFKNTFILHQPLDASSGSVSNTPVIAEATLSTQKRAFQEGSDHSAASRPTVRMRLIEAHRTAVPFSFGKPTTSAVRNPESHSLTGRAASLISALRSQTPAKPNAQTKELTLTFSPKDPAIKFTSTATKTRDSPTFTTLNGIVQQPSVYPSGPANKPVTNEPQFPVFTAQKTDVPVTPLSESRQESDEVASMLTRTPVLSKSSSGSLTMQRFSGTQSKITQEKTLDVTTPPSFARHKTDLRRESQIVHNLKLGDKSEQVWNVAAEDHDAVKSENGQGEETTTERQKSENDENNKPGDKTEGLFNLDQIERGSEEEPITARVEVNQKTDRKRQNMEERETNVSRENTEDKHVTIINTGNLTKDAAANPRERLTTEPRREETAREKDLIHNRKIGRKDVTNVPPGATTDSEELNRDKGHTVTNSSPCHSLIKRLEATEQKGIYLTEDTARNVEMKNKAFSYKVTGNHRQPHSSLRSRMTPLPTEPHAQIKARPSPHGAMITTPRDTSSLTAASARNKVPEDPFPVTTIHKMLPKHTSGVGALKLSEARKPPASPRSSSTEEARPVLNSLGNMTSLTAGFPKAQPHFTVNSSTPSLSIIYSILSHRHKFGSSASKSESLVQTTKQPGRIYESRAEEPFTSNLIYDVNMSASVIPAAPQQTHSDSSSRPLTAETWSSEAHVSVGRLQPHEGQTSRSSSSSSFDMTSGQKCSFQLSAYSHASHPPVDDNRQRSAQTLMATMSPKAKSDQLSPSSMSMLLNSVLLRVDSSPGTYGSTAITRSGSEEETSEDEYANNGSGHAENDSEQTTVSSAVKHSDAAAKQVTHSTDETIRSRFMAQTAGGSRRKADKADDFSSVSVSHTEALAVENVNENDHNNLFNTDRNKAGNNNHPSQLEGYNETNTQPIHTTEQASEHLLPVTDHSALFALDPNAGAQTTALTEAPATPHVNAGHGMTSANLSVGSATEISGRQMFPQGPVSDNAVAVPQISSRSDLKVSNTSTQQTGNQASDAASEIQIITTRNNDFVSPAVRINGPIARESAGLELTPSARVTEKSFQAAHAERWTQIDRHRQPWPPSEPSPTAAPGKHTPAVNRENAPERQNVEEASVQAPVSAHGFKGQPQNSKHAAPGQVSPVTSASDYAAVDGFTGRHAREATDGSARALRAFVDMGQVEGHATRDTAEKTAQGHNQAGKRNATNVAATRATRNSTERTPFTETSAQTQSEVGAAESGSAQSAVRSVNAAAEGETLVQESGRRLLVLEPGSDPELPGWKHRRRSPPHLYLSG